MHKTHIPVYCPPHGDHPCYSWQGIHSIALQAVINLQGTFINKSTGWAGSFHNAYIFCSSTVPALVES